MTATHWTDETIKQGILRVAKDMNLSRMPSHSEVNAHIGNRSLSSAVSKRNGGWEALARELNLPMKDCESYFASRYESAAAELLNRHGFQAERMTTNFPYDILANGCVKIDVKASRLFRGDGNAYYSFNLRHKATCDIYILFTVDEDNNILDTYIIPSKFVMQKKQIAIGEIQTKYSRYRDRWEYVKRYSDFFGAVV